jgi:hypothetical protein
VKPLESLARAERLRELPARNAERAAAAGQDYSRCWRISAGRIRAGRQGSERAGAGDGSGRVRRERDRAGGCGGGVAVPALAVTAVHVGNPSADCLGVFNDAADFALWRWPHILVDTGRVLATALKTPDEKVDDYLRALAEMAEASGDGITDPAAGGRGLSGLGGQPDPGPRLCGGSVPDRLRTLTVNAGRG